MGHFDGAKDELRSKLKAIFENNEYMEDMTNEDDSGQEFQYTGDVTYNVKVEDDGEYREYYVSNEDGDVIEIFTDEMADQDGRIPAEVRQEIVSQAMSEAPQEEGETDEEEGETDEEDEEEGETDEEDEEEGETDVDEELDEMSIEEPMIPPEGNSQGQALPENEYNHNQRVSLEEEENKKETE